MVLNSIENVNDRLYLKRKLNVFSYFPLPQCHCENKCYPIVCNPFLYLKEMVCPANAATSWVSDLFSIVLCVGDLRPLGHNHCTNIEIVRIFYSRYSNTRHTNKKTKSQRIKETNRQADKQTDILMII